MNAAPPDRGARWAAFLVSAGLLALPVLAVRFPPVTDLPQHVAQARLLFEAAEPGSPYLVQWWTPYSLAFVPLAVLWRVLPPLAVGPVFLAALGVAWAACLHRLAARRDRPAANAAIATAFFLSRPLYWGFVSFLAGFPLFLLWVDLTAPAPRDRPPARGALLAALAVALYFCHALWFAAALLWLGGVSVLVPESRREAPRRALLLAPVVALAAAWFFAFRSGPSASETLWTSLPARFAPGALAESALGGLRGPTEALFLGAAGLCLVWGLANRASRSALDGRLLAASGLLAALYAVLPDFAVRTTAFHSRWLPAAVALAVVALPGPKGRIGTWVGTALLAALGVRTAVAWRTVERDELTGLRESLSALPDRPRTIGLDFLKTSATVRGLPFLHVPAYAQVVRGGTLNFSFAEFGSTLVVFGPGAPPRRWTTGLDWNPDQVRWSDFLQFDVALVGAAPELHRKFSSSGPLEPLTRTGLWRLYRIRPPPAAAAQ